MPRALRITSSSAAVVGRSLAIRITRTIQLLDLYGETVT